MFSSAAALLARERTGDNVVTESISTLDNSVFSDRPVLPKGVRREPNEIFHKIQEVLYDDDIDGDNIDNSTKGHSHNNRNVSTNQNNERTRSDANNLSEINKTSKSTWKSFFWSNNNNDGSDRLSNTKDPSSYTVEGEYEGDYVEEEETPMNRAYKEQQQRQQQADDNDIWAQENSRRRRGKFNSTNQTGNIRDDNEISDEEEDTPMNRAYKEQLQRQQVNDDNEKLFGDAADDDKLHARGRRPKPATSATTLRRPKPKVSTNTNSTADINYTPPQQFSSGPGDKRAYVTGQFVPSKNDLSQYQSDKVENRNLGTSSTQRSSNRSSSDPPIFINSSPSSKSDSTIKAQPAENSSATSSVRRKSQPDSSTASSNSQQPARATTEKLPDGWEEVIIVTLDLRMCVN